MAITFPASPTTSQIFTSGNKSWIWDGVTWLAYGASLSPTVLKVDATNARVGINNQSPSAVLDVQATTGTALRITNTGTGNSFLVEDSTSTDSTPFVIDQYGNVGIGTNNPTVKLEVAGSTTISSQNNVAAQFGTVGGSSNLLVGSITGNTPFIGAEGASNLLFYTNAAERMRITSAGNVGIGTTSPASALHVQGGALGTTAGNELVVSQVRATNTNSDNVSTKYRRVSTGTDWTTAQAKIQRTIDVTDMGYVAFGGTSAFDVRIGSGTTDIATFVNNGNVGIGTSSPTSRLDVVGNQVIRAAATQDGIQFAGRAGGTGSLSVKLTPTTLTTNRTLTLPDKTGTVALTSDPGLILIKTQVVGTGVSSVTVTGAFSADYDNYLILMSGGTGSAAASISIEIGGSATGYYGFLTFGVATTNTLQGNGRNNTPQLNWVGGVQGASQAAHVSVQVINPFKALYTKFANGAYQNGDNYGTMQGEHRVATSYTSFKLFPDSGTLTGGTIRVYGYRNS
jgi:hypothetical protein